MLVTDPEESGQPADKVVFGKTASLHAVQARLGNPVAYTGVYPLYVVAGQYDVDPSVDPAVQTPINGGGSDVDLRGSSSVRRSVSPCANSLVVCCALGLLSLRHQR